jgi:hypothetical protein
MLKYFNTQALGCGLSRDFIKNRTVTVSFSQYFLVMETDFGRSQQREAGGANWP